MTSGRFADLANGSNGHNSPNGPNGADETSKSKGQNKIKKLLDLENEDNQQNVPSQNHDLDKLLKDAKIINFPHDVRAKTDELDTFYEKYRAIFKAKKSPAADGGLLHRVAKDRASGKAYNSFIKWCIKKHHRTLLTHTDKTSHYNPLHTAFTFCNDEFVQSVLETAEMDSASSSLRKHVVDRLCAPTYSAHNCLHLAIQNSSRCTLKVIDLCVEATTSRAGMFQQRATNEDDPTTLMTPLHLIMKPGTESDESVKTKMSILQALISADPEALECTTGGVRPLTPYQYRVQFLEQKVRKELHKDYPAVTGMRARQFEQKLSKSLRAEVDNDELASYTRMYCIRHLPRDKALKALYPPGQERNIDFDLSGLQNQSISKAYLQGLAMHLQFESVLKYVALPKLTITSDKDDVDKEEKGKGLKDLRKIFEWLRQNHVNKIIKVIVVDDGDIAHSDKAIHESVKDFNVLIWDWKKVDLCSEVIYDAARNVEEVTLYSSGNNAVLLGWSSTDGFLKFPKLRKIRLYYQQGLEDPLDHVKQFKRKIEDWPNKRCNNCSNLNCKGETTEYPNSGKIWVEDIREDEANPVAAGFRDTQITPESDNEWMRCMKDFAIFLRNIKGDNIPEIKIAVIDSGIDATLNMFKGRIALGKSFCRYPDSDECMSQYYVPNDSHGTKMAYFICQVFPKVRLYIGRLDNTESSHGRQQFTAKSAAEAIQWSIECGVDIISMSWTIESRAPESHEMQLLEKAVTQAEEDKILMFCAADDKGAISSDHCYPRSWGKSLLIGAANDTGSICDWVPASGGSRSPMFILPGLNIPFCSRNANPDSLESGSSVATAIAAGLAGVLLFCDALITQEEPAPAKGAKAGWKPGMPKDGAVTDESDVDDDDSSESSSVEGGKGADQHLASAPASPSQGRPLLQVNGRSVSEPPPETDDKYEKLKSKLGMERALSNISTGDTGKPKYPRIDQFFDPSFKHWSWRYHNTEASKALNEMMNRLKKMR